MRALPLCLFALMLTGCSLHKSPEPVASKPVFSQPEAPVHSKPATPRPPQVTVYTDATDLVSKPFRDLGEVDGEDCQATNQASPANINTARKRLQIRASKMSANAVLLHKCEIVTTTNGCYRQAICQGSALKITQ